MSVLPPEAQVLQASLHVSLARWCSSQPPHSAGGTGTSASLQHQSTVAAGHSVACFIGAHEKHGERAEAAIFHAALANSAFFRSPPTEPAEPEKQTTDLTAE